MKLYRLFFLSLLLFFYCRNSADAEVILRLHPSATEIRPSYLKFYSDVLPSLKKKKVMLVTNPSGIGNNPEKLRQKFKENNVTIHSLLGLEHGFLGLEEDFSSSPVTIDSIFQLPIYHVYKLKGNELQTVLSEVDAVIIDVQDMGMRCYTYLTVLKRVMDRLNPSVRLIVLDHINPGMELGPKGDTVEKGYENFAGEFPSLFFTGMTMGESAIYYNAEFLSKRVSLTVVPVENYKRGMQFEKTGLPWHTPSPNLPNLDSARNYFSLVFLEGINVSVGRGTQAPFVYFGASWMKDQEDLISLLEKDSQGHYYFLEVFFKPAFSKYKDKICRGLRMQTVKPDYDAVRLAYTMISEIRKKYSKDFEWQGSKVFTIDQLWGSDRFRKAVEKEKSYEDFRKSFAEKERKALETVSRYYLY